jgi:beta-glucosidase
LFRGGVAATEASNGDGALIFDPSSPLESIRRQVPRAQVDYDDGSDLARAVEVAANAEIAIVFADQWMSETPDAPDLGLPNGQDRLIEAVARANPRTVVVLETGGPVLMPWLERTAAVLEAWYSGQKGGAAIAEVLCGAVNPSGHLSVTFPVGEEQLPHAKLPGDPKGSPLGPVGRGGHYGAIFIANYGEGAVAGYKWFAEKQERPLFPFGFGLSYTNFGLHNLAVAVSGNVVKASVSVRNTGEKPGVAIPQFYVSGSASTAIPLRLAGWSRTVLQPGEERRATVSFDPRLLARFDEAGGRWRIIAGTYQVTAGFDAEHRGQTASAKVVASTLPP